ncbi:MAG: hypothetical protein LBD17_04195 [Endomicrobium sp.]|jgi:hypothetical protein|nr:hypothetical protein [Endomicrobium sp.]
MQYISIHFKIEELVNPTLLSKISEETAWLLFDPVLLQLADRIRDIYGIITVNDKYIKDAGLRDINSTTGAPWSAHKFGRALDLHILDIEKDNASVSKKINAYNNLREDLIRNPFFQRLNFENNISWLHIDTFNRTNRLFNP